MTPPKQGVTYRFYLVVGFAFAVVGGLYFYNHAREPGLVNQAILNVAPAGSTVTAYRVSSSGRRSNLWCGSVVGMENGQVAVLIRENPVSYVDEVAPAWVVEQSWREKWMLSRCREAPSRASALP